MTSLLIRGSGTVTPDAVSSRADERLLLRGGLIAAVPYLAGIAFAIWFLNTTHPAFDATPLDAAVVFRNNAWKIGVGTVLFVLPMPFVLMFLGGLTPALRRAGAALASTAMAAGVVDVALFSSATMVSSITSTIGALDASVATGAVIKAIDGVLPVTIAVAGLARAVLDVYKRQQQPGQSVHHGGQQLVCDLGRVARRLQPCAEFGERGVGIVALAVHLSLIHI